MKKINTFLIISLLLFSMLISSDFIENVSAIGQHEASDGITIGEIHNETIVGEGRYIDSWELTELNAVSYAITTDGTNIWVVDGNIDDVYKYDIAGDYIDSWSLTAANAEPYGIATDGTNIWVVDYIDNAVYKYNMVGGYIDSWELTGLNAVPQGIATDGTNIWVCDRDDNDAYKYDMTGDYIDSWSLTAENTNPWGIATDGTNIWVVDGGDAAVYKYNMVGGYIGSWELTAENTNPYGIATDGTNIWVCDPGTDEVYKYIKPETFIVTRATYVNVEANNCSFTPSCNYNDDVTLKVPVSDSVRGIVDVTNNTNDIKAVEVNTSDELVNNTFWYDASNQFVYIRTINLSTSTTVNWTVNCSYGATLNLIIPSYLEVGQYFESEGFIEDIDGNAISGMIAETRLLYPNGTDALAVNPKHNCTNGNYKCTFSTSTLIPGVYSVSIEFTDPDTGIIFKEGSTLYLSVTPESGIHVLSKLYFMFYDSDTGLGLNSELFKIYASDDIIIDASDRIYVADYTTYTGQTIYYRVDDYFDNQIYPMSGDYSTLSITDVEQLEDIPIDWYSFSVKNMNHSIVHFKMTNGSRTYSQYLYPYEPFYWNVLEGEYTINLTYYNTETDVIECYFQEDITITDDTYYWIRGYDLQDIILEIQITNASLDELIISVTANVNITDSSINTITTNIVSNLTATETNITTLINSYSANFTIIESVVDVISNNLNLNFTIINATINTIDNKLTIDFDLLNSTIDYINTSLWFNLSKIYDTVINIDFNLSGTNLTVNLTAVLDNLLLLSENLSMVNVSIGNMVNVSIGNMSDVVVEFWHDVNESFDTLTNRSTVVFNFYNTNQGLGLDRETLQIFVNDQRLINNLYECQNGSAMNLTVKDYYNFTMYTNIFTINAPFTFIDLGLTFHSWKFCNKNNVYYMVSLLKEGAARWWEVGIAPGETIEFMIPSGNYTVRLYDADYDEIYNVSGWTINNSRVFVIEGSDVYTIISGQSVITGQLLELGHILNDALMPDITIVSRNPPTIFSIYDKEGMAFGNDYYMICPPLITIATTRVTQYGHPINSVPMIPGNGSVLNGTVTILRDTLYMSGSASWVNITYTDNGSIFSNTSYVPSRVDIYGENLTINASGDIVVLREVKFNQVKKFDWTYYPFSGYGPDLDRAGWHSAGIEIINLLPVPLYEVYAIAGFSDESNPDGNSVEVRDTTNGIIVERGPDFDVTTVAIHFNLLSMDAYETRAFTLGYYKLSAESYIYDEGTVSISGFIKTMFDGDPYNTFPAQWINPYDRTFRGALYIKLNFQVPIGIDTTTMRIWDLTNNVELDPTMFIPGDKYIRISAEGMGDLLPGSSRKFDVYFLFEEYMGADPKEFHLNTQIFWGITPFLIGFLTGIAFLFLGIYLAISDKKEQRDRWKACVGLGLFIVVIFIFMAAMGL